MFFRSDYGSSKSYYEDHKIRLKMMIKYDVLAFLAELYDVHKENLNLTLSDLQKVEKAGNFLIDRYIDPDKWKFTYRTLLLIGYARYTLNKKIYENAEKAGRIFDLLYQNDPKFKKAINHVLKIKAKNPVETDLFNFVVSYIENKKLTIQGALQAAMICSPICEVLASLYQGVEKDMSNELKPSDSIFAKTETKEFKATQHKAP